ncbi:MAG: hypothetical protein HY928_09960 [Elusimicrobia bacterium]|nr:hypothetical protein [Elusimicrobiota bacterium]
MRWHPYRSFGRLPGWLQAVIVLVGAGYAVVGFIGRYAAGDPFAVGVVQRSVVFLGVVLVLLVFPAAAYLRTRSPSYGADVEAVLSGIFAAVGDGWEGMGTPARAALYARLLEVHPRVSELPGGLDARLRDALAAAAGLRVAAEFAAGYEAFLRDSPDSSTKTDLLREAAYSREMLADAVAWEAKRKSG